MDLLEFHFDVFADIEMAKGTESKNVVLDCSSMPTFKEFYSQLAAEVPFPEFFGNNLDALFDCLTDEAVLGKTGLRLIFTNTEDWLYKEDYESASDALFCLSDCGQDLTDLKINKLTVCFSESEEIIDLLNDNEIPFTLK